MRPIKKWPAGESRAVRLARAVRYLKEAGFEIAVWGDGTILILPISRELEYCDE
jgi:hypothetical protein